MGTELGAGRSKKACSILIRMGGIVGSIFGNMIHQGRCNAVTKTDEGKCKFLYRIELNSSFHDLRILTTLKNLKKFKVLK